MKSFWVAVSEAFGIPVGMHGFTVTSEGVFNRCLTCSATFPQTDDGFAALQTHEFEEHEGTKRYEWAEIDGRSFIAQIIRRRDEPDYSHPEGREVVDLVLRAEDGTLYFLPTLSDGFFEGKDGDFKCRPRSRGSRLFALTPAVPALPSGGSESTAENHDLVLAGSPIAKGGRW